VDLRRRRAAGFRAGYVAAHKITPRLRVASGQAKEVVARSARANRDCGNLGAGAGIRRARGERGDFLRRAEELDGAGTAVRARALRRAPCLDMDERSDRPLARLEDVRREQDALTTADRKV